MTSTPGSIDRLVALRKVKDDSTNSNQEYENVEKAFALGNPNLIAYGGFATSLAISAAFQTLEKSKLPFLNIYSVQGTFLGPSKIDKPIRFEVINIRDTRTFSTRLVLAKQDQNYQDRSTKGSTFRSTLALMIDFVITNEDRTPEGITYAEQPASKVTDHSVLPTRQEQFWENVKAGRVDEAVINIYNELAKDLAGLLEQKFTPEGIFYENLGGFLASTKTKQDDKKITDKITYDWFRHIHKNSSSIESQPEIFYPPTERASAACFYGLLLDGYLSFLPLVFSHRHLYDVEACSTLSFSLQFHVDDLRIGLWNLREMRTIAGGDERTFSQSRLWQKVADRSKTKEEKDEFKLIATMTQSCVMRDMKKNQSHI